MQSAAAVLTFSLDNENYSVVMDTVGSLTENESINATNHPLVNGDEVIDHVVRQSPTFSLSGAFSMGNKQGIVVNNGRIELNEIQTLFSRLMKEGVLINLYKIIHNGDKSPTIRFTQKENLIITSIMWTEKINSLGADFNFKQVLLSNVIDYDVDLDDQFSPKVEDLNSKNFSETLLRDDDVIIGIVKVLEENDMISPDFINYAANSVNTLLIAGSVMILSAAGLAAIMAALIMAGAAVSATGIGAIAVLAVAGTVLFYWGVAKVIKKLVQTARFKIRAFKALNDGEVKRFCNLILEMKDELQELNQHIKIYQLSSKDDFTSILSVNDTYYILNFNTNNTDSSKSVEVRDINDVPLKTVTFSDDSCINGYDECNSSNALVADEESQVYIHLVRYVADMSLDKNDFRNYAIVVSGFNPENFSNILSQIIVEYISK